MKIAVIVSHPIQHFCPQYASWSNIDGVNLKVFFGSNLGAVKYFDTNFKKEISWDNLYLTEFEHEFLNGNKTIQPTSKLDCENLNQKLDEYKPDLIIVYGYYHKLAKRAKKWAIKDKVKIAYISDAEKRNNKSFLKRFIKLPFLYYYFNTINYFLTVGNANEEFYKFYGVNEKKFVRMHFPIDIKLYQNSFENKVILNNNFRVEKKINENELVISVVGKLVTWKSQDHLIQLLLNLERENDYKTRIHLLIAGSGPMENEWKKKSQNLNYHKVYFLGFVNPKDLPIIYAASDVYIHPAKYEPHSLSISEATYMGCPIIVSNTTGSWGESDDVQFGKNGYVYEYGNIVELKNLILKLSDDRLRDEFSNYSIKISREFQYKSHNKFLLDLFDKINKKTKSII